MEILQNFIFPENEVFGSQEKYFRGSGDLGIEKGKLQMAKESSALFDTYYNALSMPLWRNKVGLNQASLCLSGKGKLFLEICQLTETGEKIIDSGEFDLTEKSRQIFDLTLIEFDGLVYPRVTALTDNVEITSMTWETVEMPRRSVKLGISITTYNRKNFVIPAIRRIKENLLDDPNWCEKIDFTVVDNASNLTEAEAQGVRVIPNENTGGSGGFMRGFLHYKNETHCTHVLFMDDDASLEVESIKRAFQILQFAQKDNTAVGAGLFYEQKPDELISWGEYVGRSWVKVDFWHDLATDQTVVLEAEKKWLAHQPESAYCGWWFCAFPVSSVTRLVPPFFVRGDDMAFGQWNDFDVIYANGIGCYAEDFQSKLTPMTTYLDQRNILLYYALLKNQRFTLVAYYSMLSLVSLLSARYEYSKLYHLALNDFLKMTAVSLVKSAKMKEKRKEIEGVVVTERPAPLTDDLNFVEFERKAEPTIFSMLRVLFKPHTKGLVAQEHMMLPDWQNIAGAKKIQYYTANQTKAFTVEVSRWKAFAGAMRVIADAFRLLFAFGFVRKRLLDQLDYLTSEKMWQEIFSKESQDDRKAFD